MNSRRDETDPRGGWRPAGKQTGDHVMSNYRGLLAAVLLQGLGDAKNGGEFAESALKWVFSDRNGGPFDFLCIPEGSPEDDPAEAGATKEPPARR